MVANQSSPTSSGPNPNPTPKVRAKFGFAHYCACDYLNREESMNVAELLDKLGSVKELAHDISDAHLQSYIDEAVFRWNTRKMSES